MNDEHRGRLSHIDERGTARMVDVGRKRPTARHAVARGEIHMQAATLAAIGENSLGKGDVLTAARIAGITAAKRTSDLIPLCHSLPLDHVAVDVTLDDTIPGIRVEARASCTGRTGVEMEALTAASVALLTIYDMAKAIDRGMYIRDIRLVSKSGGRSGQWRRE